MKIRAIETYKVVLPFRFSFGHSLASRSSSTNLLVKVILDDGTYGVGESVPRDYVTGENVDTAESKVRLNYAPRILAQNLDMEKSEDVKDYLKKEFYEHKLHRNAEGASWCAFEMAVLDACAQAIKAPLTQLLGSVTTKAIRYGGVVPFSNKKALLVLLLFYKLYGFETVKIKVGKNLEDDIACVRLTRQIMGPKAIIRLDANCAWTVSETIKANKALAPFNIASIEQPIMANDFHGLKELQSYLDVELIVDESLCTIEQAEYLALHKLCSGFNVRISKVGGLLPALEITEIAINNGIKVHLGAQVGESGILSSAARLFAALHAPFSNYEGSANKFLLAQDITHEDLTWKKGGYGDFSYCKQIYGLGVSLIENRLTKLSVDKGLIQQQIIPNKILSEIS